MEWPQASKACSRIHPQNSIVVETWESREKYEAYFAWRTERGDIENMESTLEGELTLRFMDRLGA